MAILLMIVPFCLKCINCGKYKQRQRTTSLILAPPNNVHVQKVLFIDPFSQQGYVSTQPPQGHASPQTSQFGTSHYEILMMNFYMVNIRDINLQTWLHQYDKPLASSTTDPQTITSIKPS